jgi:hypothetical protein
MRWVTEDSYKGGCTCRAVRYRMSNGAADRKAAVVHPASGWVVFSESDWVERVFYLCKAGTTLFASKLIAWS